MDDDAYEDKEVHRFVLYVSDRDGMGVYYPGKVTVAEAVRKALDRPWIKCVLGVTRTTSHPSDVAVALAYGWPFYTADAQLLTPALAAVVQGPEILEALLREIEGKLK